MSSSLKKKEKKKIETNLNTTSKKVKSKNAIDENGLTLKQSLLLAECKIYYLQAHAKAANEEKKINLIIKKLLEKRESLFKDIEKEYGIFYRYMNMAKFVKSEYGDLALEEYKKLEATPQKPLINFGDFKSQFLQAKAEEEMKKIVQDKTFKDFCHKKSEELRESRKVAEYEEICRIILSLDFSEKQ